MPDLALTVTALPDASDDGDNQICRALYAKLKVLEKESIRWFKNRDQH